MHRKNFHTEDINPSSKGVDPSDTGALLKLFYDSEKAVGAAVKASLPSIERACKRTVKAIKRGGRVYYIGAGTSGRIGVMDAAEIPPTFGVRKGVFNAIIAGGAKALKESVEGAEDDQDAGKRAVAHVKDGDIAFGISASGRTPFVLSALKTAKKSGAQTFLLTCNRIEKPAYVDLLIDVVTGPEIISGSTRLKAGSATKTALNMFSSIVMIQQGGFYRGMMVDVIPSNKKLRERAIKIIMDITRCSRRTASLYLKKSGNNPKAACVMIKKRTTLQEAGKLLAESSGFLDGII